MAKQVSRKDAEKVLKLVEELVGEPAGSPNGPHLYSHEHEEMPEGCWSIAYEGYGDSWPLLIDRDQVPGSVFVEAMTSWCLGLYPAVTW